VHIIIIGELSIPQQWLRPYYQPSKWWGEFPPSREHDGGQGSVPNISRKG